MSTIKVNALRHTGGSSDNISLDSSANATLGANATVTGNLTVSGTGNQSIAGTLQFNSGYGSVATAYGVRAWVNFNGTGTVAIRASGNVSSITDNGGGSYDVNFTTAMPDANYATVYGFGINGTSTAVRLDGTYSTTSVHVQATNSVSGAGADTAISCIAVLR